MSILEVLGLNLGNLGVSVSLDQRSALRDDTVLLPRDEDVLGLRESVIAARNIVEETIEVPTPELEDILAKLRDLESQVEGLLGDDSVDAVEVTTTTENADQVDGASSNSDVVPGTGNNDDEPAQAGDTQDSTDADDNVENGAENEGTGASDPPNAIPGSGIFKEKIQVETEVVTSTMDDVTSTITKTRTMTQTVTIQPDPEESATEEAPETSATSESEPDPEPSTPKTNVRLGGAFKEAAEPFRPSNATAVQLNAEKPSKIPGDIVSAPTTPLPVPAVKQFHQALYTNTSTSSGFQTVTLPGAQ